MAHRFGFAFDLRFQAALIPLGATPLTSGVTIEDDGTPEGFLHSELFILVDTKGRLRGMYDGTDIAEVNRLLKDINTLKQEAASGEADTFRCRRHKLPLPKSSVGTAWQGVCLMLWLNGRSCRRFSRCPSARTT